MKKEYLDNLFKNIFINEKSVFSLSLPVTIIYKYIFSQNAHILQLNHDLLHSEIDVLASLLFNNKIMSPTDLYEATIFSSGGMTKILKKLEHKKLISRIQSNEDKRSTLVKLEPKGEELVKSCFVNILKEDDHIFSVLDEKEKESLAKILKKLVYSTLS